MGSESFGCYPRMRPRCMLPDMGATARSVGDWVVDEQKLTCMELSMQLLLKYQGLELNHQHMSLGEEDGGISKYSHLVYWLIVAPRAFKGT